MVFFRRVKGESMEPTLRAGQIVVCFQPKRTRAGRVVILNHGGIEKIKRVKYIRGSKVFVVGDNPSKSTDSRQFGWLNATDVVGSIVWPIRR